jgi:hypothetical protein
MKKYNKPMMEIVELQSKENMAAVNPVAATASTINGVHTTVYNLALAEVGSLATA